MLVSLDRSGLCHKDRLGRHIDPDVSLPEPDQILRTITFEHQDLSAEILVAASAMTAIDAIVAGNGETVRRPLSTKVVDALDLGAASAHAGRRRPDGTFSPHRLRAGPGIARCASCRSGLVPCRPRR